VSQYNVSNNISYRLEDLNVRNQRVLASSAIYRLFFLLPVLWTTAQVRTELAELARENERSSISRGKEKYLSLHGNVYGMLVHHLAFRC